MGDPLNPEASPDELHLPDRVVRARSGRLATIAIGTDPPAPHLVPLVFVVLGGKVYSAVDSKPKGSLRLRRLDNIAANPLVCLIVDHYDDDWRSLWWVRIDGEARIITPDDAAEPLAALAAKYPQYVTDRPPGPVIEITPRRVTEWQAGP